MAIVVVSTAFCSEGNNAMVATDYFGLLLDLRF